MISSITNIKTNLKGKDLVNKKFVSKKGFPKGNPHSEEPQYVKVGEVLHIESYDEMNKLYKLVNLDVCEEAWFLVDDEELDDLLRRGNTK